MKLLASTMILIMLSSAALAQHCPYDGGVMVVVELVDRKGEPMFGASMDLTLAEVDNPNADKCKYAPGLLSLRLRSPVEAFLERYSLQSSDSFAHYCSDCSFTRDGFYAAVLGQAERTCMPDDDQGIRARSYEVRYSRDGIERKLAIRRENFFSLCSDGGKWSRIKPVRFQIDPNTKSKS